MNKINKGDIPVFLFFIGISPDTHHFSTVTKEVLLPLGSTIYSNGDKSCTVKLLFSSQVPDSRLQSLVKVRDNFEYIDWHYYNIVLYRIFRRYISRVCFSCIYNPVINSTRLWSKKSDNPMVYFFVNDLVINIDSRKDKYFYIKIKNVK